MSQCHSAQGKGLHKNAGWSGAMGYVGGPLVGGIIFTLTDFRTTFLFAAAAVAGQVHPPTHAPSPSVGAGCRLFVRCAVSVCVLLCARSAVVPSSVCLLCLRLWPAASAAACLQLHPAGRGRYS